MAGSRLKSSAAPFSLKALLVATIVAPVVLFLGASYDNYQRSFDDARERIVRENELVYEHAAKVFETYGLILRQAGKLLQGLDDDQIRNSEKTLHDDLAQMIAGIPQIKDIYVDDHEGRPLVTASIYPAPRDLTIADRDYFTTEAAQDAGTYISRLWFGRVSKSSFFTVTRRRPSGDGSFTGIMSVSVQPSYFEQFYHDIVGRNGKEGLAVSLTRADGQVLVRVAPGAAEPVPFSRASGFARTVAVNPDRGVFETVSEIDGRARLLSYRKLPDLPIYVAVDLERSTIIDAWLWQMGSHLIYGIPATLGLVAITWMALRRSRRAAEEADRRLQAETALRQAQKLEAIGQLTGGIAHDFNNLLLVISGSVQLLRRGTLDKGKLLEAIERAARRGERLTRQLLTFSRQRRSKPTVVDLRERLPPMLDMLARSLRANIYIHPEIDPALSPVEVDRDELELALLNIAVNAQDAMPNGGPLTVSARNIALAAGSNEGTGLTGPFVMLTIRDRGIGMSPEIVAQAFEPFFTTKPAGKGSGLGLSQVYGFANQARGAATIQSAPGQGTRVTIYLPQAQDTASHAVADPIEEPPTTPPSRMVDDVTVLLVEDDPEVGETSAAMLEDLGCKVVRASSAGEAVEVLAKRAGTIDLVISDVVMRDSASGIELAREMRSKYPELPVILVTGYSDALSAASSEGHTILFKPYDRTQLEQALYDKLDSRNYTLAGH